MGVQVEGGWTMVNVTGPPRSSCASAIGDGRQVDVGKDDTVTAAYVQFDVQFGDGRADAGSGTGDKENARPAQRPPMACGEAVRHGEPFSVGQLAARQWISMRPRRRRRASTGSSVATVAA
jgi:hypothetical protein